MKLPSKNKKTHSSLIRFPLSYNYKHSLYNGIFFGHLKLPMLKPLYKKGDRTSVANWVNQSVNHFTHPLCQVFDTGHISKGIVHKFMYGITCLFCPTQWLALCFISGGGGPHIMLEYQTRGVAMSTSNDVVLYHCTNLLFPQKHVHLHVQFIQDGGQEGAYFKGEITHSLPKLSFFSLIGSTIRKIQCFSEMKLLWKCLLDVPHFSQCTVEAAWQNCFTFCNVSCEMSLI